ncbi:MAG: phosphonate ABC transporter, permease protein PhnE [Novosphingobium sp.]|nr:phosphonate ABC transporter, permease protein PhnE [Novosphingobium sp.]
MKAEARLMPKQGLWLVPVVALIALSAPRMEFGRVGLAFASDASAPDIAGLARFWPPQIETRTDIANLPSLDPDRLPPFSRLETSTAPIRELDPDTLETTTRMSQRTWLVSPLGYLGDVALRMVETIEIGLWGTLLAVVAGLPLAFARSRAIGLPFALQISARLSCAALRALPELLVALLLVGAIGFGPTAGVLALGVHAAGFIGRFYADAFDDADQHPIEAIRATGAGRMSVFIVAVLPQVRASLASATLYILDRNVRMATVIGIVGAGGIGQELKGRIDLYEFGHATTIVIAIFIVVAILDEFAAHLRKRQSS